jgi:hypothetical protein
MRLGVTAVGRTMLFPWHTRYMLTVGDNRCKSDVYNTTPETIATADTDAFAVQPIHGRYGCRCVAEASYLCN